MFRICLLEMQSNDVLQGALAPTLLFLVAIICIPATRNSKAHASIQERRSAAKARNFRLLAMEKAFLDAEGALCMKGKEVELLKFKLFIEISKNARLQSKLDTVSKAKQDSHEQQIRISTASEDDSVCGQARARSQ